MQLSPPLYLLRVIRNIQAVILFLHGHPPSYPALTPFFTIWAILMITCSTLNLFSFRHACSANLQPPVNRMQDFVSIPELPKSYWRKSPNCGDRGHETLRGTSSSATVGPSCCVPLVNSIQFPFSTLLKTPHPVLSNFNVQANHLGDLIKNADSDPVGLG